MRIRVLTLLLLVIAGVTTFSLTRGQERVPPAAPSGQSPRRETPATGATPPAISAHGRSVPRDFSKLNTLQKEMLHSCQRGADWLYRVHGIKGRFLYGYLPALKLEMEGDHYLRQVGAAYALARTARFLGEERYAARATQAILALLDDTVADSSDPQAIHIALPSAVVNRLGAAAMLVLAINELPAPQADLLEKSEQLCRWIHHQARADGSLKCNDASEGEADDADCINEYPGLALYAVLRSHKHRPADWKTELARKAVAFYRGWWKEHRNMAFVPAQTAAYAEAFARTKDPAFAEFVHEMNDWLCGLQYDQIDPQHLVWYGGFKSWQDGRVVEAAPAVGSALYAESLAEACRVARGGTDLARHQRYTEALERCLQFVVRLQYTDANVQHFADWYRPRLVGAFHASTRDGNLRIDYTHHALTALVAYLEDASP